MGSDQEEGRGERRGDGGREKEEGASDIAQTEGTAEMQ